MWVLKHRWKGRGDMNRRPSSQVRSIGQRGASLQSARTDPKQVTGGESGLESEGPRPWHTSGPGQDI